MSLSPYRILAYHSVNAQGTAGIHPTNVIPIELFGEQMRMLAAEYEVVTIEELTSRIRGRKRVRSPALAITFDDGYADFRTHALPILRSLGLPVAVYVCCGLVEKEGKWDDRLAVLRARYEHEMDFIAWVRARCRDLKVARYGDLTYLLQRSRPERISSVMAALTDGCLPSQLGNPLLTWDEICSLSRCDLVTIGLHSWAHDNLVVMSEEEIADDCAKSRRTLHERTGISAEGFCYPFGSWDRRVRSHAVGAGFSYALTCDYGFNDRHSDLFALRRILVGSWSPRRLRRELSIWTSLKRRVRRRIRW